VSASTEPGRRVSGDRTRRHRMTQQGAGPRGGKSPLGMLHTRRTQQSINLCRTDRQQFLPKSFRQRRGAPFIMFEPLGSAARSNLLHNWSLTSHTSLEHRPYLRRIIDDFRTAALGPRTGPWPVQKPQGGFPMITASGAKLVEDARLVRRPGPLVSPVNAVQSLSLGAKLMFVTWVTTNLTSDSPSNSPPR
jgi:hypothetical protein